MNLRPVAVALSVMLLAGCASASAEPLTLRAACDEVAVVQAEFGQVEPDAERFAEYAPKVRAVVDRADEAARRVLEPVAAAMEAGDVWQLAGASLAVQPVCQGAGSTVWAG